MANFSFDYGNAHWTVLDSNPNVNWMDPALSDWVAKGVALVVWELWPKGRRDPRQGLGEDVPVRRLRGLTLDLGLELVVASEGRLSSLRPEEPLELIADSAIPIDEGSVAVERRPSGAG